MTMTVIVSLIFVVAGTGTYVRHIVAKNPVLPKDNVYTHVMLWDDEKCKELVGPSFDRITSHNQKRVGAYKADLCRLFVLYEYGGVYTDDDIWLLKEPPVSNISIIVIKESTAFKPEVFYFNAFISVPRKRHPGILNAIRLSLKTINNITRDFSDGSRLWGPWVLFTALQNYKPIELQETCKRTPCDCFVKDLLWSHRPCAY